MGANQSCTDANAIKNNSICRKFLVDNKGSMDKEMLSYCQKNFDDPICSCMNSPKYCPLSTDRNNCTDSYISKVLMQPCSVTECVQYVTQTGGFAAGNEVNQACSTSGGDPLAAANQLKAGKKTDTSSGGLNMNLLIIAFVFIFIVIIAALLIAYKIKTDAKKKYNDQPE